MANLINKAKEASSSSDGNNFDDDDQFDWFRVDVDSDIEYVRTQPTVQVNGTFPEYEEGNPIGRNPDPENNNGRYDQGYLMISMDDMEVEDNEDVVILYNADRSEYRVFDLSDRGTTHESEGMVAFDAGQGERIYRGEEVDSLPEGRVRYSITGGAAKNVARRLDVCGLPDADMEDGEVNDGLIEKVPPWVADDDGKDSDDNYSRYARDPELREDLRGERVSFVHGRGDEMTGDDTRQGYHYVVFDKDGEEVEPTDEGRPTVRRERDERDDWLNRTFLSQEWGRFQRASEEDNSLPQEQQKFVDAYLDAGEPTDADTVRDTLEGESFEEPLQEDRIVSEIQQQA